MVTSARWVAALDQLLIEGRPGGADQNITTTHVPAVDNEYTETVNAVFVVKYPIGQGNGHDTKNCQSKTALSSLATNATGLSW